MRTRCETHERLDSGFGTHGQASESNRLLRSEVTEREHAEKGLAEEKDAWR
jgi:hypothetical protein